MRSSMRSSMNLLRSIINFLKRIFSKKEIKISYKDIPGLVKKFRYDKFRVDFIKRNGELRHMCCKVSSSPEFRRYVTGKGMKYNPKTKGLVVVYDLDKRKMKKEGFRCFPINRTINLTHRRTKYTVE